MDFDILYLDLIFFMITIVMITAIATAIAIIPKPNGENMDVEESCRGLIIRFICSSRSPVCGADFFYT
ncbi:MAG: hypothetical protein ACFFDN_32730 [Candidatus Hodarchaeota archaeon]